MTTRAASSLRMAGVCLALSARYSGCLTQAAVVTSSFGAVKRIAGTAVPQRPDEPVEEVIHNSQGDLVLHEKPIGSYAIDVAVELLPKVPYKTIVAVTVVHRARRLECDFVIQSVNAFML